MNTSRLLPPRLRFLPAALALALLAGLALPGVGSAANAAKVDGRLTAQAAASGPAAALHVLVSGSDPRSALLGHGGSVESSLSLISSAGGTVKAGDLDALASDARVSFVAADVPVNPTGNGSLDASRLQTLYPQVDGAPAAWARGLTGLGVGVAVIDSGISKRKDFKKSLVQVDLPGLPGGEDSYGHGTLVGGVVAGQSKQGDYVGVAPDATLFSIDVNRPTGVRSSDVIAGLQWVFEHAHADNIRVVNLSLAETVKSSYQTSLLDLAVERVWAAGVVVVVAAGNSGAGESDFAPANDPLALTVGATDTNDTLQTGDDAVATFSSTGVTEDGFVKPELVAPGRHIASTIGEDTTLWQQAPAANRVAPGYASISGTSFAAPQVAAGAAILLQEHPDWSPDNVKWLLGHSARPVAGALAGSLSLSAATSFSGSPGLANQGVPALVCAPGGACVTTGPFGTVSSSWNSSSWNSSSWNSSSWNSSSWNSSSWNSSSWNSSSWNSSSWNSSSWNSSSWNSSSWNSVSWNSFSWN